MSDFSHGGSRACGQRIRYSCGHKRGETSRARLSPYILPKLSCKVRDTEVCLRAGTYTSKVKKQMGAPQTFYSNAVNVKTTQNELVFEFGAVFLDSPVLPGTPVPFNAEVRVVMTIPALKVLADVLQQALAKVERAQKDSTSSQPGPARTTSKQ